MAGLMTLFTGLGKNVSVDTGAEPTRLALDSDRNVVVRASRLPERTNTLEVQCAKVEAKELKAQSELFAELSEARKSLLDSAVNIQGVKTKHAIYAMKKGHKWLKNQAAVVEAAARFDFLGSSEKKATAGYLGEYDREMEKLGVW